jgi:hypothetical protein
MVTSENSSGVSSVRERPGIEPRRAFVCRHLENICPSVTFLQLPPLRQRSRGEGHVSIGTILGELFSVKSHRRGPVEVRKLHFKKIFWSAKNP